MQPGIHHRLNPAVNSSLSLAADLRVTAITRLLPGQMLTALVKEQIAEGNFKVFVAGREIQMALPATIRAGQTIPLRYDGPSPQLRFTFSPPPESNSYRANMSDGAKLAAALIVGRNPGPITSTIAAPSMQVNELDGHVLESHLRRALVQSGLFYESHQAQWVNGNHPLAELLKEPQGQLSQRIRNRKGEVFNPDGGEPSQGVFDVAIENTIDNGKTRAGAHEIPAHPESLSLIQHQLSVLESGRILWQGQVWPQQTLDWEINERSSDSTGEEAESGWSTRLNLEMNVLGTLDARLQLHHDKVSIALNVDNDAVMQLMQQQSPELISAMQTAGLVVSAININHHAI